MDFSSIIQFFVTGITLGAVYSLVALGVSLLFSATEVVNLAHGVFLVIGGMLASILEQDYHLPAVVAIVISISATIVLAVICERLTIWSKKPQDPLNLALITIGVYIVLETAMLLNWGTAPRYLAPFTSSDPINLLGATIMPQTIWIIVIGLILMLLVALFFNRSMFGQGMVAASISRVAASLVGVNPSLVSIVAFGLSAGLGAVAGIVVMPVVGMAYDMGFMFTLKGFAAAVLGGLGKGEGAIIGGFAIGLMEAISIALFPSGYKDLVAMVIIILVLNVRPSGIMGSKAY